MAPRDFQQPAGQLVGVFHRQAEESGSLCLAGACVPSMPAYSEKPLNTQLLDVLALRVVKTMKTKPLDRKAQHTHKLCVLAEFCHG
jgi:hypothetical protein